MDTSACHRLVGKLLPQRTSEQKRRICATDQDGNHRLLKGPRCMPSALIRAPDSLDVSTGGLQTAMRPKCSSFFANADFSKGYKGTTCFVATKDMGIQIAKKEQKLGIRASSTCALKFDDLKIPEENIIGGLGQGSTL